MTQPHPSSVPQCPHCGRAPLDQKEMNCGGDDWMVVAYVCTDCAQHFAPDGKSHLLEPVAWAPRKE